MEGGAAPYSSAMAPSGSYVLIIVSQPLTEEHKKVILKRLDKGLLSWDVEATGCDLTGLESVCSNITSKQLRDSDVLIQHSTESLGVGVLVSPTVSTLKQCIKNLFSTSTGHKHLIHAGYAFAGSGSWILQNGAFSFDEFLEIFQHADVQAQKGCHINVHCAPVGRWTSDGFAKLSNVSFNPPEKNDKVPGSEHLISCLSSVLGSQALEEIMEASPLVGNIRFNRPTLYMFPAGQGDCALFGINGFNMLVDGGFNRKPCSWEFIRHLDRLDAVLVTRLSENNLCGMSTLMKRKALNNTYPQIGYVFCNIADGKTTPTQTEAQIAEDDLIVSVVGEGHNFVQTLNDLKLKPHQCWRDSSIEPFVLYHKVGHGTLEMHVLSPPKDSKEMKDFLSEWSSYKETFSSVKSGLKNKSLEATIPLSHATSICAVLVWRPADPKDTITRILFPGSAPQSKIFESLEKLKGLDILNQPVVTKATLSTIVVTKAKNNKLEKSIARASIPNRKNTASPALSVSSVASRNGDIGGLKKDVKDVKKVVKEIKKDNKEVKEIKKEVKKEVKKDVAKDVKKDGVAKEIKSAVKEIKKEGSVKKDNKEVKKVVKKETKELKSVIDKKPEVKNAAKKMDSLAVASKTASEVKKTSTVRKSTPIRKDMNKLSGPTKSAEKPEVKKIAVTKTAELKSTKDVTNKKTLEARTATSAKPKASPTSKSASKADKNQKPVAVPKPGSKMTKAVVASSVVASAVAVTVAAVELNDKKDAVEEPEVIIETEAVVDEIKAVEDNEPSQEEVVVSPLPPEALSPTPSDSVSLTPSDTLSSAPLETVSPTPPLQNDQISTEEKEVNEIKDIDQDLMPYEKDIPAEDETIPEDALTKQPIDEIQRNITEAQSDADLMTTSFMGEKDFSEEVITKTSAITQETVFSQHQLAVEDLPEAETENVNEKVDLYSENQFDSGVDQSNGVEDPLAGATMEGSFCSGMMPSRDEQEEQLSEFNIKKASIDADNIAFASDNSKASDIGMRDVEFEDDDIDSDSVVKQGFAIREEHETMYRCGNYEHSQSVAEADYHESVNETSVSKVVEETVTSQSYQAEESANVLPDDDYENQERLVSASGVSENPADISSDAQDVYKDLDSTNVKEDQIILQDDQRQTEGFEDYKLQSVEDYVSDAKSNLDTDSSTVESDSKEDQIAAHTEELVERTKVSEVMSYCDTGEIQKSVNQDDQSEDAAKDAFEDKKYVELEEEDASSEQPEEILRKESAVSITYNDEEPEDYDQGDMRRKSGTESEDDVDIQHYLTKEPSAPVEHGKLSVTIPENESDSDDEDVVKSPTPHAIVDYEGHLDNVIRQASDIQKYEKEETTKECELYPSEKKQDFDEKDRDSAEEQDGEDDEEMIRHPTPPDNRQYEDEMRDPITQHFITAPPQATDITEQPIYEEPEDSGSERSQSPVIEQPVFGSAVEADFPELVTVSGGTTPSEPQSPKSGFDSKKFNADAALGVMEALSEHDCSESSTHSPLCQDGVTAFEMPEQIEQIEQNEAKVGLQVDNSYHQEDSKSECGESEGQCSDDIHCENKPDQHYDESYSHESNFQCDDILKLHSEERCGDLSEPHGQEQINDVEVPEIHEMSDIPSDNKLDGHIDFGYDRKSDLECDNTFDIHNSPDVHEVHDNKSGVSETIPSNIHSDNALDVCDKITMDNPDDKSDVLDEHSSDICEDNKFGVHTDDRMDTHDDNKLYIQNEGGLDVHFADTPNIYDDNRSDILDNRSDVHDDNKSDIHDDSRSDIHDDKSDVHDDSRSDVHDDNRSDVHEDDNRSDVHEDDNRSDVHEDDNRSDVHEDDNRSDVHEDDNRSDVHDDKSDVHDDKSDVHDDSRSDVLDDKSDVHGDSRSDVHYKITSDDHDGNISDSHYDNRSDIHDDKSDIHEEDNRSDVHDDKSDIHDEDNRSDVHDDKSDIHDEDNRSDVHDDKSDIHEEYNRSDIHDDKSHIHEEYNRSDVHEDNRSDVHEDNRSDVHEDNRSDIHEEDNRSDIHDEDNRSDIYEKDKSEIHENISDIHEDDNRSYIHEDDTRSDIHEDNRSDIHEDNRSDIHEDNRSDIHVEDNRSNILDDNRSDVHDMHRISDAYENNMSGAHEQASDMHQNSISGVHEGYDMSDTNADDILVCDMPDLHPDHKTPISDDGLCDENVNLPCDVKLDYQLEEHSNISNNHSAHELLGEEQIHELHGESISHSTKEFEQGKLGKLYGSGEICDQSNLLDNRSIQHTDDFSTIVTKSGAMDHYEIESQQGEEIETQSAAYLESSLSKTVVSSETHSTGVQELLSDAFNQENSNKCGVIDSASSEFHADSVISVSENCEYALSGLQTESMGLLRDVPHTVGDSYISQSTTFEETNADALHATDRSHQDLSHDLAHPVLSGGQYVEDNYRTETRSQSEFAKDGDIEVTRTNGFSAESSRLDHAGNLIGDLTSQLGTEMTNGKDHASWTETSSTDFRQEQAFESASSYSDVYTSNNLTKVELESSYIINSRFHSDSPEDNVMRNDSSPDAPYPADPEGKFTELKNALSSDTHSGGFKEDFTNNMNFPGSGVVSASPNNKTRNVNRENPYGESSEDDDSSSLPGTVSPYAYTNKAYAQEEEDVDGNHIYKESQTSDVIKQVEFDGNNPQTVDTHRTSFSPGYPDMHHAADNTNYDFHLEEWGKPMGLPTPPDSAQKTAVKKTKTTKSSLDNGKSPSVATKVMSSPLKKTKPKTPKESSSTPVYVDLAYVPHHGDPQYCDVEFFKKIRARYYVFSGINPSKEVLNALLEAKKSWNEDLEVTIIPTYETDTLGYWMAQNQDALAEFSIEVAPSASRCTVNLQDHETSCAAYRLEF